MSPATHPSAAKVPTPGGRVLKVENLSVEFFQNGAPVEVVAGISFNVSAGRTLCLVGESGCGKSVSMMAILGLLNARRTRVRANEIDFEGRDLRDPMGKTLRQVRGRRIGMIFQDPMTSLNPTMPVGEQIAEVLRYHLGTGRKEARRRAIEMLDRVRIPRARERVDEYPFQFSGGMRQRVMIALALVCSPSLLIADEPTTALDVTVQAGIFDLLRELQRETGTALLLITHDLGVVAEMADQVAVMYAGRIVEQSSAALLFECPQHPYTIGLFGATPEAAFGKRLAPIPGRVPSPSDPFAGCRFAPRCPFAEEGCRSETPLLTEVVRGQHVACLYAPLEALPP